MAPILAVGDKDIGVAEDSFHLLGVGDHVGRDVTRVELHAFDDFEVGARGFGFLHGDDAVFADFFHGFRDEFAISSSAAEMEATWAMASLVSTFWRSSDFLDNGGDGFFDAVLEDHRVGAGGYVAHAFADHGLSQQGGGGGTVAATSWSWWRLL
jgi:hypothetical protein